MIKIASFSEAHKNRYLLPEYPAVQLETHITNLIADFRNANDPAHLNGGQALFAEYGEGIALTHSHPVDQWQVYLTGSAQLAKKPVSLISVQYTDKWVPYGPIEVSQEGFALLAFWPRPNAETHVMPKDADIIRKNLKGKPHRIILENMNVTDRAPAGASEATLIAEAEIWARCWQLPAGATLETPDPASGGGQFFVPLQGSLGYEGDEYRKWSSVYIGPQDGQVTLRAGTDGANVLGMQFAPQE